MAAKVEPTRSGNNKRKHDSRNRGNVKKVTENRKDVVMVYTTTTTNSNATPTPQKIYTGKHPQCNKCKRHHA